MLRALVAGSLRHRGVVVAAAVLAAAYGVLVTTRTRLDVFPEFAPPLVVIHTQAPGFSAEEVENLVTRPVEYGINGVGNLESIRSQSIQGLSVVTAIFREQTGLLEARQMVSERLTEIAEELPAGVGAPVLAPLTSSTSLILGVGLTSTSLGPMELRTLADWTVRPRLLGVPGVASVVEFGGAVRQLQVRFRPERLLAFHLTLDELVAAAREATGVLGAGFVETPNQRLTVRSEGQALTPAELGQAVVARQEGAVVRLADVAEVVEGPEPKIGDAAIQGEPGVLLQVWSQYGANTLEVTRAVEDALAELEPTLAAESVVLDTRLFRPADFIETSLANVGHSVLVGGAFVAVVLFLFLLNLRTALISLVSIPLSLLVAVVVLDAWGVTLNTLTLGGFAIAVGVVVDDAIIDVENIHRRLRLTPAAERARVAFRVVLEASLEVRGAVVYATFIVGLVFLPVLAMSGVQGKLFAPLGIAFILATLASLAVALTVTPALCLLLLGREPGRGEPPYIRWLKGAHRAVLARLAAHPDGLLALVVVSCLGAATLLPLLGGEFLPEFQEQHLIVQMSAAPGIALEETLRLGQEASRELLGNPYVRSVALQVGRAELGEDTAGPDFGELVVGLKPTRTGSAEIQASIRRTLGGFPGVVFSVKPFLEERIEETLEGTRAEIAVRLYGDDLDLLDALAARTRELVRQVPGSTDVRYQRSEEPQLEVALDRAALERWGFRPLSVLRAVRTAWQGMTVGQVYDRNRVFDVVVRLDEGLRRNPANLARLLVANDQGRLVPLGELARVFSSSGRHAILHDGTRRYQEVSCNLEGRDLASFVADLRQRLESGLDLPRGVYWSFAGAATAQSAARRELLLDSLAAAAGILLLLAMVFHRPRNLFLVLANLPFALVGGVLAAWFSGGSLSLGSLVGFVTLFGITARNSIMMVSHFEHLVTVEGMSWGPATALRGANERLVPILLTAMVTGFALLPLALGSGEAGREIEGPMAIVILGGLATSTLLTLLVLPSLALRFGSFPAPASTPEA